MALRFPCPTCKRELSGPESITGSEVQCPACHTVFRAGQPRGAGATGMAAERHSPTAPRFGSPYRNHLADEDHPPRPVAPSQRRGGQWFGLVALLVFAPLAFIGIVAWVLMGRSSPTTMPPLARTTTTTKTDKWGGDKPQKWQVFTIPNTTSTVSLPGTPVLEPEKKVEDAVVNRLVYRHAPEVVVMYVYTIATIRMPPTDPKGDKVADWLREQLATKVHYETTKFRELREVKTIGGVQGFQWTLEKDPKGESTDILQAYLTHDDKGTTIYVFEVHGLMNSTVLDRGGIEFFNSIQIGEDLRQKD